MRAGIYIRKSRKDTGKDSCRLQAQRIDLPQYAMAQGWSYEIYDDGYASASKDNVANLRERSRLESDIRAGKIGIVLVIEISRLSRDESMEDFASWIALCADHGARIATPSRVINPAIPSEWMMLVMEGGMSSTEMKVLKTRMSEGRSKALALGKFPGGTPPRPYVLDKAKGKLVVDQESLAEMKRLWALAETHSAKAIAEELILPEIAVRRMLSDARLDFYQAIRRLDNGEMVTCEWDPVMSAEQAARIRAARRTRKTNGNRRMVSSLLSGMGLLVCGYCDKTVKTWTNSKIRKDGTRIDYYGCQKKNREHACKKARLIAQPQLDERVIINVFNTITCLEGLMRSWAANRQTPTHAEQTKRLRNDETAVRQELARLMEACAKGVYQLGEIASMKKRLESKLAHIATELVAIEARQATPPDWDALLLTRPEFDHLDLIDQRRFLSLVLENIRLFDSYAMLTYKFPRSEDGDCTSRIQLPPPSRKKEKTRRRKVGVVRHQTHFGSTGKQVKSNQSPQRQGTAQEKETQ